MWIVTKLRNLILEQVRFLWFLFLYLCLESPSLFFDKILQFILLHDFIFVGFFSQKFLVIKKSMLKMRPGNWLNITTDHNIFMPVISIYY